jgi:hypothetical protein
LGRDRWLGETDLVGLPQGCDFGANIRFAVFRFLVRKWQAVETLQLLRDAAAFQQNSLSRDLRWMRRENGSDRDLIERLESVLR